MSVIPVVIAQIPTKINSVYARTTKNSPPTQNPSTIIMIPLIRVSHQRSFDRLLIEGVHHPHHADEREHESEDVGESREGRRGVDQRDDPGRCEEHGEDRPGPAPRPINGS